MYSVYVTFVLCVGVMCDSMMCVFSASWIGL